MAEYVVTIARLQSVLTLINSGTDDGRERVMGEARDTLFLWHGEWAREWCGIVVEASLC